jgi:hypothetical protein
MLGLAYERRPPAMAILTRWLAAAAWGPAEGWYPSSRLN